MYCKSIVDLMKQELIHFIKVDIQCYLKDFPEHQNKVAQPSPGFSQPADHISMETTLLMLTAWPRTASGTILGIVGANKWLWNEEKLPFIEQ